MGIGLSASALATPEKASSYYEDALKRYEKNEMPAAVIQLKNALQQDSKMLAAHLLLGKALLRNGDLKGAEAAFEEALKQGVNRGEVALPLGRVYLALGRPEMVIERISAAGLSPALQVEVLTMRGNAYIESGKNTLAVESFENARAIDPKSASPLVAEVPMLLAAGRLEQAKDKANKAVELAPNDASAWNVKAAVQHASFDASGALVAYGKALTLAPNHVDARIARAALLIDLKRDGEARSDLDYLKINASDEPRAAYLRAVMAGQQNDAKATNEALTEVTRTIDTLPPAWLMRREQLLMAAALAHYGLGNHEKSREYLDALIARSPNNFGAKKLLASIYVDTKEFGRAQPLLESLQRVKPDDPQVMFLLGSVNLAQRRYAQASNLFEQAAARTGAPEMTRSLGFSQLGLGQADKGVASLEKAYAANPDDARAGMALATIYIQQSKKDKALKIAEALIKRNPENLTALNFLGTLKGASGDKAGARAAYTQVLTKNPSFAPSALNMVRLDVGEKRFDEARRRLDMLLKQDSNDYRVLYEYGILEQRAERPVEAIRHLTKAGDVQRNDPSPTLVLIDIYLKQRQGDQALTAAKLLASKFAANLKVQLALAQTYLAIGDAANARAVLTGATRLAEFEPRSQVTIARLQIAAANLDGAAYSLSKALQGNPDDVAALSLAVQVEARRGNAAKADEALKMLNAKHPTSLDAARASADLAMSRGKYPAAIAGYRKLLSRQESTANALALVEAQLAAGELAKAVTFLEGWTKNHTKDKRALKALAETQFQSSQLVAAKKTYQQVIAATPNDAVSLNNYANLLLLINDPAAEEMAERALKLSPTHPAYADTLGWVLVSKGQAEAGLRYLRDARLRSPDNGEIRFHLAYALAKLGRKSEAREELKAVLENPRVALDGAALGLLKKDLGL
ncbi:XrtA/PEP-CTERM system TPR-repeat protein PrsT [Ferribacterium limneticum]|uniref:XrtA/PEP-CTERM system TPR-repeat protein PrsT n=1 Tax=Ferribacterium limneticum TaxID=76259 RepID=UPI001CF9747C|nr:XrtA/PEP-CTERM system TPR-repeat protein PrsT [Ferribacterium limneticum]UCV17406.1 PEP-CTERM system TPR-repeat protein PrsT [Ferribacterium limneticum]